jgi:hypothetical protein
MINTVLSRNRIFLLTDLFLEFSVLSVYIFGDKSKVLETDTF